jgi:hypothetical protein
MLKQTALQVLCRDRGITAESIKLETDASGTTSWIVVLKCGKRWLQTNYTQGSAYKAAPRVADVVQSVIADGVSGSDTFEDFCHVGGYDTDSRKARDIWKQCAAMAPKVRAFFGVYFNDFANAEH